MLNLVNVKSRTLTEVVVTDESLSKRCHLLKENCEGGKLTSIVVRSLGNGFERKFDQYHCGLVEQPVNAGKTRVFIVNDIGDGALYDSTAEPAEKPTKKQRRKKGKGKRQPSQPAGKRRG